MGFWDFHQTFDRHWQWRHVFENTGSCIYSGRFRSRNDCIADAMRHGYPSELVPTQEAAKLEGTASALKDLHAGPTSVNRLLVL